MDLQPYGIRHAAQHCLGRCATAGRQLFSGCAGPLFVVLSAFLAGAVVVGASEANAEAGVPSKPRETIVVTISPADFSRSLDYIRRVASTRRYEARDVRQQMREHLVHALILHDAEE